MLLKEIHTELFANYFQFYIQDEMVSGDLSGSWNDEAVDRLLALGNGTIGIGTARNMDASVIIKIYEAEPQLQDNDNSIHMINECDLEMNSDRMVIAGCTDYFPEAMRVGIGKGLFRVRIYYKDLDKISDDGLDGEDSYEIHIWPTKEKLGIQTKRYR